MTLNSYAELQPVQTASDKQESILIITDDTSEASQLTTLLSEKGYSTFNLPLFSAITNTIPEHIALIVVVNCQGACCQLKEDVHFNHNRPNIPIICLNAQHNRDRRGMLNAVDLMASTHASQRLPIQGFSRERPCTTQERRHVERRKSVHLISNFGGAEAWTLEPDGNVIHLSIVSERDNQINKLAAYFSDTPSFNLDNVCVKNLRVLPKKLAQSHPEVLLVDTAFINGALTEWLQAIRQAYATVKIILLYDDESPCLMNEIVAFGISGIIKTSAEADLFKKAIRTVNKGELWLPHHLMSLIISHFSQQNPRLNRHPHIDLPGMIKASLLTQREISITPQVARGLTNKAIAKKLEVSPETIKKHLKSIFEKSGVHTRSQLASIFSSSQIIESLPG